MKNYKKLMNLIAIFVLVCLLFGCSSQQSSPSNNQIPTAKTPSNTKTVTLLTKTTNISAQSVDWGKASYRFTNGEAVLQYNGGGELFAINKLGEIVESTNTQYNEESNPLDLGSQVVFSNVQEENGMVIPESGRVIGENVALVQTGTPGNYQQWLYDLKGNKLCETSFSSIGYFYKGLALVEQNGKLGIIDEAGNIVVSPDFVYDAMTEVYGENNEKSRKYIPTFMNEDAFIVPINGYVAIVTVQR